MRTSLGIASYGLLDRGAKPALHIATEGLLRTPIVDMVRGGGGTAAPGRPLHYKKVIKDDEEIIQILANAIISGVFDDIE